MIRIEIGISLEIILNISNCLTVSCFTKILALAIIPHSFISVSIPVNLLCCQMCAFQCPLSKKRYTLFLRGQMYTSGCTFIKKTKPFARPAIISACLGNTFKKQDCKITALSLVLLVSTFDKVTDELRTTKTRTSTVSVLIIRPSGTF